MNFNETEKFKKDFKRLAKKYRSLDKDLSEFKRVISEIPLGTDKHFAILRVEAGTKIAKARLFCQTLRGSSLRVVYGYRESLGVIDFIELYYKGEQEREDSGRILDYLATVNLSK